MSRRDCLNARNGGRQRRHRSAGPGNGLGQPRYSTRNFMDGGEGRDVPRCGRHHLVNHHGHHGIVGLPILVGLVSYPLRQRPAVRQWQWLGQRKQPAQQMHLFASYAGSCLKGVGVGHAGNRAAASPQGQADDFGWWPIRLVLKRPFVTHSRFRAGYRSSCSKEGLPVEGSPPRRPRRRCRRLQPARALSGPRPSASACPVTRSTGPSAGPPTAAGPLAALPVAIERVLEADA